MMSAHLAASAEQWMLRRLGLVVGARVRVGVGAKVEIDVASSMRAGGGGLTAFR